MSHCHRVLSLSRSPLPSPQTHIRRKPSVATDLTAQESKRTPQMAKSAAKERKSGDSLEKTVGTDFIAVLSWASLW